jgi:hypothetical protein
VVDGVCVCVWGGDARRDVQRYCDNVVGRDACDCEESCFLSRFSLRGVGRRTGAAARLLSGWQTVSLCGLQHRRSRGVHRAGQIPSPGRAASATSAPSTWPRRYFAISSNCRMCYQLFHELCRCSLGNKGQYLLPIFSPQMLAVLPVPDASSLLVISAPTSRGH